MGLLSFSPSELLGPLNEVELKNAPETLFAVGNTNILDTGARVSIVGARKASPDGIRRAAKLASLLVKRGIVVISGLAEGIDAAAHESAMKHGGHTVAVLGTPLDQVYPKQHAALQDRIMREQLVISQYPAGSPIKRKNFPLRNQTMALISDATVIIEASDTSGSLSQGWEALRLGRLLLMTKGVAEDPALKWPAELRHFGARVLSDDSFEEFLASLPMRRAVQLDAALPF
jgi:DNA processing protein